jgi:low affinity Fe/Cu permease
VTSTTERNDPGTVGPGGVGSARPRSSLAVHRVHELTSRPTIAIWVGVAVVAVWAVIVARSFDESLQFAFDTVCAGVTVVMVFVLQHTQRRSQSALQLKLDELVRAIPQADDHLIGIEASSDDELLDREQRHLEDHVAIREGED